MLNFFCYVAKSVRTHVYFRRKISQRGSLTLHTCRTPRENSSRDDKKRCRNNARRESIKNPSCKAYLVWGEVDIYDAQLRRILIKLRYRSRLWQGRFRRLARRGKKRKRKKKRMKKKQPRSFHAKWWFRSTGITLNLRIGRAEEREQRRQKEIDSRERKKERKREKETHSRWYRRQMHLHSVLLHLVQLSAALSQRPRSSRERKRQGKRSNRECYGGIILLNHAIFISWAKIARKQ